MELESVNVGRPQTFTVSGRAVETGIDKLPVACAVIGVLGVEGDAVLDVRSHGGPDQAVYLYSREDYAWWEGELGRPLAPGTFGENLTVSSFGESPLLIGSRITVGEVVLEATGPRIPCGVFASRMGHATDGEETWVRRFKHAERPGAYARVLTPGTVTAGDPVTVTRPDPDGPSLLDNFRVYYDRDADEELVRRILAAPVAERARRDLERRLAR